MLIYVLKQMPHDDRTMHEMLDQCAEYYQNNQTELAKIEQFRTTYTSDRAINWYTDECFLYKLLNQALRTEDIQLLYSFRFFIIDLCAELERESEKIKNEGHLTVYRGQMMHKEEFHKLQHSIGGLISTNGFFSTSRDINIAFGFLTKSNSTNERVLFEIQADPSILGVICADISSMGSMPWEREVLFSLNTVFQIVSVNTDSTHDAWKVQLVASDQGAQKVNEYVKWLQIEIDYSSPLVYFGRLLWSEFGQLTQAENYFKMLLDTLPVDHPDMASVNLEFSHVYDEKGDYDLALQYSERALHIRQQQKPIVPHRLAACLNSMGVIYRHKGDLDRALDYYQQSLTKYENEVSSGKHLHHANTLRNLGGVHKDKGNFDIALDYFTRAYEIYQELLPADHPRLADALSNIGSIYHHREDFDQALGFYQQALDIQEKNCLDDHLQKANTIRNIALIYRDKKDWSNAMNYCDRALTMYRRLLFFYFSFIHINQMTLPRLFAHIDGIEAILVLDKDGQPILKLPTAEIVDQLDLRTIVPSAQTLQDQSSRMNLKKLKTVIAYWSARQIITYNVPPLVFIIAADTNVNTGALVNLYNDFQTIAIEDLVNKA
ncbi:unnamed protein product [Rotaria sp. Silwood1]|nr:unnamed protein product [Rotaria sp. Silwood1]